MWIQQQPNAPAPLAELQGRAVGLKFECNHCHTEVFTDLLGVPAPNDQADSSEHAANHEIEEVKCPGCDMTHTLEVDSTFDGVTFKVSEVAPGSVSYQLAEPK
jgi:Zn finger protein HypA/HybF involved in hydrogenase expression